MSLLSWVLLFIYPCPTLTPAAGQLLHQHHHCARLGLGQDFVLLHVPSTLQSTEVGQGVLLPRTIRLERLLRRHFHCFCLLPSAGHWSDMVGGCHERTLPQHSQDDYSHWVREPYSRSIHFCHTTHSYLELAPVQVKALGFGCSLRNRIYVRRATDVPTFNLYMLMLRQCCHLFYAYHRLSPNSQHQIRRLHVLDVSHTSTMPHGDDNGHFLRMHACHGGFLQPR
jgi:hypothetical protein